MNTKQEAPVSAGDAIKEFQRCIIFLSLELPKAVWEDVNKRWDELKSQISQPVSVQVEGLREDAESYFDRNKQTFTGVFAGDYLDREDFINYILSSLSGQEKDAVGLSEPMKIICDVLRADKSDGSYYYSWQANIAMAFKDEYNHAMEAVSMYPRQNQEISIHQIANDAAKRFLDLLTYQPAVSQEGPKGEEK